MKLHPDLPEFPDDLAEYHYWDLPTPLADVAHALSYVPAYPAGPVYGDPRKLNMFDVASIEAYSITYENAEWKPGSDGGTELNMVVLGTLKDGHWFSITAWNDFTGWGCQDDSVVKFAASREEIILQGLDISGRIALGLV